MVYENDVGPEMIGLIDNILNYKTLSINPNIYSIMV
jgi:hypothetical protein